MLIGQTSDMFVEKVVFLFPNFKPELASDHYVFMN